MTEQERGQTPLAEIDRTQGRDELNLAEFPLFSLAQRIPSGEKTLAFETTVEDKAGNVLNRRFEMVASEKYGLPTVRDADVLLALVLLAKRRDPEFESPEVYFSRYELCEVLGWGHGGKSYDRITQALLKWKTISLFHSSWWSKDRDRFEQVRGFSLVDDVTLNSHRGRGSSQIELPLSSVVFGRRYHESLRAGNIRRINLAEYFTLRIPAARQLYRILGKRFYHRRAVEFDLRTLAQEHVGLSRNYKMPSKIKEKLAPAIEELESIGFIEESAAGGRYAKTPHTRSDWTVRFRRGTTAEIEERPLAGSVSDRPALRRLIKKLTDRGVSPHAARGLAEDPSVSAAAVEAKVELLDWLVAEGHASAPSNPGGWLVKAIAEDYSPPPELRTAEERAAERRAAEEAAAARKKKRAAANRKEEAEKQAQLAAHRSRWDRVSAYVESLPASDRKRLIDEAIAAAPSGPRWKGAADYRRSPETASMLARSAYEIALTEHVEPRL